MRFDGSAASQGISRRALLRHCLALSAVPAALAGTAAGAAALKVGEAAPAATLVTLAGDRISTTDLVGQVVVLTFWATWCVPCRDELPLLSAYATEHSADGLRVLGFCLDGATELAAVQKVARTLSFPVGLLGQSSVPGYGRIWRVPVSFTIGRDGRLVDDGWKDPNPVWTTARLQRIVQPLLTARG